MFEFIQNLYKGRIGRKFYFLGLLVTGLFFGGMSAMFSFDGSYYHYNLFGGVIHLAGLIMMFSLHVRRYQDIGINGWWSLLLIIPMVNFFAFIYLVFTKGDSGKNIHGEPLSANVRFLDAILNKNITR